MNDKSAAEQGTETTTNNKVKHTLSPGGIRLRRTITDRHTPTLSIEINTLGLLACYHRRSLRLTTAKQRLDRYRRGGRRERERVSPGLTSAVGPASWKLLRA
jgi:hypothetical protein